MTKYFFFFSILFVFNISAQSDTIRLEKNRNDIFKCETEPAFSWYILLTNEQMTLADIKINPKEINDWFDRFGNSQNLYRAKYPTEDTKTIFFHKKNDPLDILIFEFHEISEDILTLTMKQTGEVFTFEKR